MNPIRKHFVFTGRVQGVGFRYTALYAAQSLGLTGWVRNEWNGNVEMEVQGSPEAVQALLSRLECRSFIRIDHIASTDLPLKEERGFHVR